jgi:predicted membrane chloride channel (bestrophin family)
MINRKIKMAKELIKLAKLLIIGYKLVGYDILCKKIKDIFTDKKKDLKADYFCNISIDGRSNAINKTISFHANKKSISKNEIYPDNIKVDVKVNTDGNNCVIAATY